MALRLYNTMTRQKDAFTPLGSPVTLYACGVTPYDTTHLGHARTYVVFDVLQRYLEQLGMPVRYVQNVTDVDDPLFAKARDLGIDYRDLAAQCVDIFIKDLHALNVRLPAVYPRVSEEIPYIQDTVRLLLEREMAYVVDGYVFFRAGRSPEFGAMSRLDLPAMLAADKETGEDPQDPRKESPLDFRLWQPSAADEPFWESPWGPGRPGWHIECSTMSSRHLGSQLDIHGGGEDLIFPHHCSEIAQSEAATGLKPFVGYWMHVGLVFMDGEKMSKSLGNLAFVRELTPRFGGDALRYYLLRYPYRERLNYVEDDLARAAERWQVMATAARSAAEHDHRELTAQTSWRSFQDAMDDDLDTRAALAVAEDVATHDPTPRDRATLAAMLLTLGFRLEE